MAYTDTKNTGDDLTSAEYNNFVKCARHILAEDAQWSIFDSNESPNYLFKNAGTEIFRIDLSGDDTLLQAADDMRLVAGSGDDFYFFDDSTQMFKMAYNSSKSEASFFGPSGSNDDLVLYANSNGTGTRPFIGLYGSAQLTIDVPTGRQIYFAENGSIYFEIASESAATASLKSISNNDIHIDTGSGKLRLENWSSSGDAAVNGYFSMKDQNGAAVKVATIA